MLAAKQLGDLHRVERRALAEIVADDPEAEAVLDRRVLADPADIGRIVADALDRRHVTAVLMLIDNQHAGRLAQDLARFVGAEISFSNSMFTASE